MKLLFLLGQSSRPLLLGALATSVLGGVGGTWLVAAIHRALDASTAELPRLGLEFAGGSIAVLLLRWASRSLFVELSQATMERLRRHISANVAEAPYREVEALGAARLLVVLTEDVATVAELFVLLPRLVLQGAVVLGCLGYLTMLSWSAFLIALTGVALGSCGRYFGTRRASEHLRRARRAEDDLYASFRGLFAGAKELKLHAARRRAFVDDVLGADIERVTEERTRGDELHLASVNWGVLLFYAMIGAVLFLPPELLGAEPTVRSGYALMFLYMMLPVHSLLEALPELSRTRVALERIDEAGLGREPRAANTPLPPGRLRSLRLDQVTHSYRREGCDGVFQLGPLSLELRPGEIVFLIGGNGSGKTTLAKLLVGLYAPESGEVLVDGVRVESAEREAYRQQFSTVFTDFHLFDGLLGVPATGLGSAQQLLDALGLSHKVRIEAGNFSTTQLSTGQRKRLALLVAMLEDRPVYVFDEWAADQDPEYKEVFYGQVLPELRRRGKLVLVISHDDRYYHSGDRCLELKEGKLRAREAPLLPAQPQWEGARA
jgi:putative pyoverdin transport system ATP-binding/permease protein